MGSPYRSLRYISVATAIGATAIGWLSVANVFGEAIEVRIHPSMLDNKLSCSVTVDLEKVNTNTWSIIVSIGCKGTNQLHSQYGYVEVVRDGQCLAGIRMARADLTVLPERIRKDRTNGTLHYLLRLREEVVRESRVYFRVTEETWYLLCLGDWVDKAGSESGDRQRSGIEGSEKP